MPQQPKSRLRKAMMLLERGQGRKMMMKTPARDQRQTIHKRLLPMKRRPMSDHLPIRLQRALRLAMHSQPTTPRRLLLRSLLQPIPLLAKPLQRILHLLEPLHTLLLLNSLLHMIMHKLLASRQIPISRHTMIRTMRIIGNNTITRNIIKVTVHILVMSNTGEQG
mmetsp:Transcript_4923/g.17845  ORF Transcript_4923/g.17845 Transcript_4923/m.17845 type:complete len:165 (-) Transcript_4923:783-1277(-)